MLPVTFGDPLNFRTERLQFEVVDFAGSYHSILGRPCYAKFMAVPNYTYLKLKMPGPRGVITVGTSFKAAYQCERANCELAASLVASKELADLRKGMPQSPKEVPKDGHQGASEGSGPGGATSKPRRTRRR